MTHTTSTRPASAIPLAFAALAFAALLAGCESKPAPPVVTGDAGNPSGDALATDTADTDTADTAADTAPAETVAGDAVLGDTQPSNDADSLPADGVAQDTQPADAGVDSATADLFACQTDPDCTAIETKCCDHCNGGQALAVAKASEAQAKATFGPTACTGVACTEKACSPAKVACINKKCDLEVTPVGCAKLDEANCANASGCMKWTATPQPCDGKPPGPAQFLGCTAQVSCTAALTCATDAAGAKWLFGSGCLPPGYQASPSETCCPAKPCTPTPAGKMCIRGKMVAGGEAIEAGDPVQIHVYPKGCFSSSCTQKVTTTCTAMPGNLTTFVTAEFCFAPTGGPGCTADCSGGGFASCDGGLWGIGEWPFKLDGLAVTVTVPSKLPFGGVCVGSPF